MPESLLTKADMRLCAVLAVLFGVVYAILSRAALHAFPFSGDEYSTVLQAEIFARGAMKVPAPAHAALFSVDHVVIDDWVRSKYPPGTSALLALGFLVHAPWLVAPIEATVTLSLLAYVARAMFGDRAALVTVIVAGASPLFIFHAACFYSHAPVTMWLATALAALVAHDRDPRRLWLLVAGAAIGCAFLTRPLEAVLFSASLLALRDVRVLAWIALGAIPVAALMFAYQKVLFGSPFTDGYAAYMPTFRVLYPGEGAHAAMSLSRIIDPDEQWDHLKVVCAFFVAWGIPGAAAVAIIGVPTRPRAALRVRDALVVLVLLMAAALVFTHTDADDGARPRYLTSMLFAVALFAGPGWLTIKGAISPAVPRSWTNAAGLACVALGILSFASFLDVRLAALRVREGLFDEVEARGLHDAVVVVHAEYPTRYTRNGSTFDGSVLYVRSGIATDAEIASWFPGRTIYEATEGRTWSIRPVVPAS